MGILIKELDPASDDIEKDVGTVADDCDLIVDAILGTGLKGELSGGFGRLINAINLLNKRIVAVDIPSGLDCDTGLALGTAIKAAVTVTFAAAKERFYKSLHQRNIRVKFTLPLSASNGKM